MHFRVNIQTASAHRKAEPAGQKLDNAVVEKLYLRHGPKRTRENGN